MLAEIAGLPAVSLQPAAGAHGEMTALLVAAAYFRDSARSATTVLIPDAAHGTNPASAAMAGFTAVAGQEHAEGLRRPGRPGRASSTTDVAVFMITNPNTLGLFERQIARDRPDGPRRRRPGLPGRGQHERDPGHRPARRFRRRHDALQPAQDVQRPARRRRSGGRADRRGRSDLAPYLPVPIVVKDGQRLPPGLRPAQVDRPRAELLRQHRRAGADVLLPPHARAGRAAARRRKRRAQRQLSAQPGEALPARAARRPLHARVRRLGRRGSRPSAA